MTGRAASKRPKLLRRERSTRRTGTSGNAGGGSGTRVPPKGVGRAAAAARAPGAGRSAACSVVAVCMARTVGNSRTVRERSTSRCATAGSGPAVPPVRPGPPSWPSQRSGTTAKTASWVPVVPSSPLSRGSSNHSTGAVRSPRAAAQIFQVCATVPRSVETTWYEKLLYLKVFCQYFTPRIRYWSVSSASAGASGPSASRTRSVTSPVSSRCRACRWTS